MPRLPLGLTLAVLVHPSWLVPGRSLEEKWVYGGGIGSCRWELGASVQGVEKQKPSCPTGSGPRPRVAFAGPYADLLGVPGNVKASWVPGTTLTFCKIHPQVSSYCSSYALAAVTQGSDWDQRSGPVWVWTRCLLGKPQLACAPRTAVWSSLSIPCSHPPAPNFCWHCCTRILFPLRVGERLVAVGWRQSLGLSQLPTTGPISRRSGQQM